jgi:hypothetical protein
MRIVIYDDESFEPVSVINLRGVAYRDIEERGRHWRVAVPVRFAISEITVSAPPAKFDIQTVDLEFEPIIRKSRHGEQRHWLCFTRAADLAMKLNPAWLPGQRPVVEELHRQNDRFAELLLSHITR